MKYSYLLTSSTRFGEEKSTRDLLIKRLIKEFSLLFLFIVHYRGVKLKYTEYSYLLTSFTRCRIWGRKIDARFTNYALN